MGKRHCLGAGELRRSLLEEGSDAFGVIEGGTERTLRLSLGLECGVEIRGPCLVQQALGRGDGLRRALGQTRGHRRGCRQQLVVGHHAADQADPFRRGGVERGIEQGEFGRAPTIRGRNQVAPLSGTSAMRLKARTKRADSAAMRRSQARASEAPAPAATPLIAAMIGRSSSTIARMIGSYRWRSSSSSGGASGSRRSPRSWPAQKARPAPVRMTARTERSAAIWRRASSRATLTSMVRALRAAGRSSVSVATPSAIEVRSPSVTG
jgi:hypothetical protein